MRSCSVSVRLAASLLAVAAASGCMSVGDDGAGAGVKPSPSAGRAGGAEPEGGKSGSGRYVNGPSRDGDGKGAHDIVCSRAEVSLRMTLECQDRCGDLTKINAPSMSSVCRGA
ncbi:hypothetical protein ACVNF4_09035, partial [Streptomyces sp. S6]